jgi:hypothetical protein
MGFESPAGWIISGNASINTTASPTTTRTQGNFALALGNPADLTKLTSAPVASIASALSGVGNAGALFEVDVMLPIQQGNPVNRGSLELFISCPSRQLNNEHVGKVDFTEFRLGIYTTMKFPIPDRVRSALGGVSFNDLTFHFMLSSPGTGAGTYLFDNLRVHSVALVTANASTRPPAGFGGSIDLVAIGNTPVAQLFDAGPVQVPDSFHLKLGAAGTTTVQLDIGYDGKPAFTCMYGADSSDPSGKSYILVSCTGGMQAGDLVGASWAQLTIVGGDPSMKIRAQLAKNPVGDLVGGGIIPPMPTFWGDSDGCIAAPAAGKIVTVSASCASQTAEASRIVTNYFNKVSNSNSPPNWIVTPVPEFARRHGNGSPHDNLTGPPPPNDPPFDEEGHMNPGGTFDAYWRLSGFLNTTNVPSTDRSTTDFDATFSTHAVLFGEDVNILSIRADASTDTGETTPEFHQPQSSASLHLMLFGIEIPPNGFSTSQPGHLPINLPTIDKDFDLPPIPIWIFTLTIGVTASVGVQGDIGVASSGLDVAVTPFGSVGAHLEGSVNLGIASGGVDARIDLLSISTPVKAQAAWRLNTAPNVCAVTANVSLNGQAQIAAGGGEVDLVASFGVCPFCTDASWTLFKWDPLFSYTKPLFDIELGAQAFPLPTSLCRAPLSVAITKPAPGAIKSALLPVDMTGVATSSNGGGSVPCGNLSWSLLPANPQDTATPMSGMGCTFQPTFAQPVNGTSAQWTINLSATFPFTNPFGQITESGQATPVPITINAVPAGDRILQLVVHVSSSQLGTGGTVYSFQDSPTQDVINYVPAIQGPVTLTGVIIGAAGRTCTTWSATQTPTGTPSLNKTTSDDPSVPFSAVDWTPVVPGAYTVTMSTVTGACGTTGGVPFGTNTVSVLFEILK